MPKLTRRLFLAAAPLAAALRAERSCAQTAPLVAKPVFGAPAALQPGLRLVWLGSAASIPGERQQLEPDPDGEWVNKATGQRFRQFDTPGPAGMGFTVMDVLAMRPGGILLNVTQLLVHTDMNNATSLTDVDGLVGGPQAIGDYWLSDARIGAFVDRNDPGLRILHASVPVAGTLRPAVRVQTQTSLGWTQNAFDVETGIDLVASSATQGGPVQVLTPQNQIAAGAGSTQLTFTQFVGARRTGLPGPGSRWPESVRRLRGFAFAGTSATTVQGSDMQVPPIPLQSRFDVTGTSDASMSAQMTTIGMPGAVPVPRTIVAGAVGSLWMDPGVLASLAPNQVLDRDSNVGMQVSVLGRQGNVIVLGLQTALTQQVFGYDGATGMLMRFETRQIVPPATITVSMQFAGSE